MTKRSQMKVKNLPLAKRWSAFCKAWVKSDRLFSEGTKLQSKGQKLKCKGDRIRFEGQRLQAHDKGNLRVEGYKRHAEGSMLRAEGDRLYALGMACCAEGDKSYNEARFNWLSVIFNYYGDIIKCGYDKNGKPFYWLDVDGGTTYKWKTWQTFSTDVLKFSLFVGYNKGRRN